MKIVVGGGGGFIGRPLLKALLEAGHEVTLLTRRPEAATGYVNASLQVQEWDGETIGVWVGSLAGADAVINLAGEPIGAKRWTRAQKEKIVTSRVRSTALLVESMRKVQPPPKIFLNASAVGYYGSVAEGEVTEESLPGSDFLAETCRQWEAEAERALDLGVRVVRLRIGIVLGEGGGALAKMLPPFRLCVGGSLGSGQQWLSWVHRDDVIGAMLFCLENEGVSGPVNVTAPHPVRMREFCQELGHVLHRPCWISVPSFALKILKGEMAEMLVTGQKALPRRLINSGYSFRYPTLSSALQAILRKGFPSGVSGVKRA